jgi:hypothetical protein
VLTTKTLPSIIINKNTENFAPELRLFPIKCINIDLTFTGDRISNDVGLLLLLELGSHLSLLSSASKCIHDERDQCYIDHTVKELLSQRVFQIAAGYEDCNDCNDLREDMIFKMCAGRFLGRVLIRLAHYLRRSDRLGGLPRLSLLRTIRATFAAYGSSTFKTALAVRSLSQANLLII